MPIFDYPDSRSQICPPQPPKLSDLTPQRRKAQILPHQIGKQAEKRAPGYEQRHPHPRIEPGAFSARNYGRGMLSAPPANGHVINGHIHKADNSHHGSKSTRDLVLPKLSITDQVAELGKIVDNLREGRFESDQLAIVKEEIRGLAEELSSEKQTDPTWPFQQDLINLRSEGSLRHSS